MTYAWEEEADVLYDSLNDSSGNLSKSFNGSSFDFDDYDLDRLDPEARNELETLLFAQIHFAPAVEENSSSGDVKDSSGITTDVTSSSRAGGDEEVSDMTENVTVDAVAKKKRKSENFETPVEKEEIVPKKKKKDALSPVNGDKNLASTNSSKEQSTASSPAFSELIKTPNSLATILATIPDHESWAVDYSDAKKSLRRVSRYFAPTSSLDAISCFNCGKKGHLSKYCPGPKKFNVCYNCGRRDHRGGLCENVVCTRCLGRGHQQFYCRIPIVGGACFRCQGTGHLQAVCPEIWRQHHLSVGEDEDSVRHSETTETNDNENGPKPSCFNCGRWGHFGHQCQTDYFRRNFQPHSPFVSKYDGSVRHRPKTPLSCPNFGSSKFATPNAKGRKIRFDEENDDNLRVTLNFDEEENKSGHSQMPRFKEWGKLQQHNWDEGSTSFSEGMNVSESNKSLKRKKKKEKLERSQLRRSQLNRHERMQREENMPERESKLCAVEGIKAETLKMLEDKEKDTARKIADLNESLGRDEAIAGMEGVLEMLNYAAKPKSKKKKRKSARNLSTEEAPAVSGVLDGEFIDLTKDSTATETAEEAPRPKKKEKRKAKESSSDIVIVNEVKGKGEVPRIDFSAGKEVNSADVAAAKKRKIKRPITINAESSPRETVISQVKAKSQTTTESEYSLTEVKQPDNSLQAKAAAELARIRVLKSKEKAARKIARKIAKKKEVLEGGDKYAQDVKKVANECKKEKNKAKCLELAKKSKEGTLPTETATIFASSPNVAKALETMLTPKVSETVFPTPEKAEYKSTPLSQPLGSIKPISKRLAKRPEKKQSKVRDEAVGDDSAVRVVEELDRKERTQWPVEEQSLKVTISNEKAPKKTPKKNLSSSEKSEKEPKGPRKIFSRSFADHLEHQDEHGGAKKMFSRSTDGEESFPRRKKGKSNFKIYE